MQRMSFPLTSLEVNGLVRSYMLAYIRRGTLAGQAPRVLASGTTRV